MGGRGPRKNLFKKVVSGMANHASHSMEDEKALVKGCARRDAEQWELFTTRYDRLIKSTAATVLCRAGAQGGDVQDLVGHVYEMLLEERCRRLTAWRGQCRLSTYLVQVTRNLCIDRLRRSRREAPLDAAEGGHFADGVEARQGPLTDVLEEEEWRRVERQALQDALKRLPQRQSIIMRLRLRGKSLRQIATLMGIPEGTVFVDNSRAMDKLRVALTACRKTLNGCRQARPAIAVPQARPRGKESP